MINLRSLLRRFVVAVHSFFFPFGQSHVATAFLILVCWLKIKPLTEEEKTQKLAELRQKMAEKRAKKAEQDAIDNKANEMIRRKAAKVRKVFLFTFFFFSFLLK